MVSRSFCDFFFFQSHILALFRFVFKLLHGIVIGGVSSMSPPVVDGSGLLDITFLSHGKDSFGQEINILLHALDSQPS